ncbi:MAG TPA: ribosome small subunit-dependent GTPase A [Chroococcales cyanobacterium]
MIPFSFAAQVEPPLVCGRVIEHDVMLYTVSTECGEVRTRVSGSFAHHAQVQTDFPVVGDYVALRLSDDSATIEELLPRTNLFARRGAYGSHEQQPIAANLDTLFITIALNRDFNVRRLERYAVAAAASEVASAILLTKLDLVDAPHSFIEIARSLFDLPILAICSFDKRGFESLAPFMGPEKTVAFVGSSGAGKSTLINALLGDTIQSVQDVRIHDDRGKHTTTRRSILRLPDGTSLIDTPGMREFALSDADEGISKVFQDVATVAAECRFADCTHEVEPGCAVREQVGADRLNSWRKLKREAAFETRKTDRFAAEAERNRWKTIHKANRERIRARYKDFGDG